MWWQLLRMWHWSLGEPGEKRRHSRWMEIARSPPSLLLSPPASNRRSCSQAFRSDALSPVSPSPLALSLALPNALPLCPRRGIHQGKPVLLPSLGRRWDVFLCSYCQCLGHRSPLILSSSLSQLRAVIPFPPTPCRSLHTNHALSLDCQQVLAGHT